MSYLGQPIAPKYIKGDQKFYVGGSSDGDDRDKVWYMYVSSNGIEKIAIEMTANAEETDTRIWMHVTKSHGTKKLVFSPDTDVYHIGLTLDQSG